MALFALRPDFDPFRDLLDLQKQLDRFFRNPQGFGFGLSGHGVFPAVNLFGDKEGIVIRAEIPGVEPSSVQVQIDGQTLSISGERQTRGANGGSFHRRERPAGKFSRSIQLPRGLDRDKAAAECRNGVLTVRISRAEEMKPRLETVQGTPEAL
jgi:HSP20 family protein